MSLEGIEMAIRDVVEELKTMNARLTEVGEIRLTLDEIYSLQNKLWKPYQSMPYDGMPNINDIKLPEDAKKYNPDLKTDQES